MTVKSGFNFDCLYVWTGGCACVSDRGCGAHSTGTHEHVERRLAYAVRRRLRAVVQGDAGEARGHVHDDLALSALEKREQGLCEVGGSEHVQLEGGEEVFGLEVEGAVVSNVLQQHSMDKWVKKT